MENSRAPGRSGCMSKRGHDARHVRLVVAVLIAEILPGSCHLGSSFRQWTNCITTLITQAPDSGLHPTRRDGGNSEEQRLSNLPKEKEEGVCNISRPAGAHIPMAVN